MPEAPVDESAQAPAAEPQPVARTAEDIAREQQEFAAKQRRAKQTVRNLLIALLACLGVVVVLLVAVPRDDSSRLSTVDFHQVADGLQDSAAMTLAVPDVDDHWIANRADYTPDTDTGLDVWYVGLRTPNKQFISITQSSEVNATGRCSSSRHARPPAPRPSTASSSPSTTSATTPTMPAAAITR